MLALGWRSSAEAEAPRAGAAAKRAPGVPRSVALMTGTFDPIHDSHLNVARAARDQLGVGRVILLPNVKPKDKAPEPLHERLHMGRKAVKKLPGIEVASSATMRRFATGGVEAVMKHLERSVPGVHIYRISGSDSFLRGLQEGLAPSLSGNRHQAVVPRPGSKLPDKLPKGVHVLTPSRSKRSSSKIRKAIAAGEPVEGVPVSVIKVMAAEGLYRKASRPARSAPKK